MTFCWTPVSLFFDYAMSPSSRLRLAMLVPKVSLILSSRYQVMYASSRSMNPLMVTPAKSRPRRGLPPGTPEEPLRGRVVRGAALRAHGSGQLVLFADADPSGPPVVATAVGVDDRTLPVAERGARVAEHPVGQLGVRARADRPGHRHPVTAVDHRTEVDLARGDAEIRQVGRPQPVRPLGVEVPVDEVVRRLAADLALVRAVAAGPLEQGDEPVPRHEPHDALRGHSYAHAPQFQMDALVPVAPSAVPERLPHHPQEGRVPVRPVHRVQLMIVRAARQTDPGEQTPHGDAVPGADRPDEDRLLPIGRVVRVCAPLLCPPDPTPP